MKRFPPRRLLVAADLSAPSTAALNAAKELAARWNASLEIVHARVPPVALAWGEPGLPVSPPYPTGPSPRETLKRLGRAAEGFPAARLRLRMAAAWAPEGILALAGPARADLLITGTHGYAGFDRLLMGSVSEALIQGSRIPVLAVPAGSDLTRVTRVLAPWNGRPYATRALRWAREAARAFGASLVVLYVAEPGGRAAPYREALRRRLSMILGKETDWSLLARAGDARGHIIAQANSGRYQLVVLSAHRRAFASDVVLGSTTERVLRHAATAVLAVPSGSPRRPPLRRLAARAGARLY